MIPPGRPFPYAWIITLLLACAFFGWAQSRRMAEVEFVTSLGAEPAVIDARSPTGYAGGVRQLLAPGHNNESYQWIAQTQQMIAQRAWRLRQVDYDNAPAGRVVLTPSPYRWWLAAVAWMDHVVSGRPIGLSVERAALWADPLLSVIFLIGATLIVARRMGGGGAVILPLALVAVYPFAGGFLPGGPDDNSLAVLLGATTALLLLAGLHGRNPGPSSRGWFVASGIAGGFGLWVNVGLVAPVLAGLALGAAAEAWINRRGLSPARPWRAWAVTGAITVIVSWLVEYAPHHLGLEPARLVDIHPWYALTWLGAGEILCRGARRLRGEPAGRGDRLAGLLAAGLIAVVPVIMIVKKVPAFLVPDAFVLRLTPLGENTEAANWATWLTREGASLRLLAMMIPLGFLGWALMRLWSATSSTGQRSGIVLLLGPVAVSLGLACTRLSWWNQTDVLLLLLFVAAGAGASGALIRWPAVVAILGLLPGAAVLFPPPPIHSLEQLTRHQKEAMVERNFAQWLARRTGPDGAIVLAPPSMTASLYFHGGLRGLGSPYRENADGFRASVRLAGATSADEAQALARQRKLTHIAIPSWDDFLEEYARLGADQPEHTLTGLLHAWLPPRWLRPVPYYLPEVAGFEDDRLVLFEVTEPQDQAAALSRLTEYFLDMGQVELASLVARTLATDYASDLGSRVALARTELAQKDRAAFAQSLDVIAKGLQDGSSETLAWDRRVSLAVVLAEGGRQAEAKVQVQRCLEEMGELDIRGLSQATLYRFLVTAKNLGLRVEDAGLRDLSRSLLPARLQSRIH